jgi:hypothetical protein
MPNITPGCLAISCGTRNAGRLMQVLYRAPDGRFMLPNGNSSGGAKGRLAWVVELLDGNIMTDFTNGFPPRAVRVGVAWDECIKPITPDDEEFEDEAVEEMATSAKGAEHG